MIEVYNKYGKLEVTFEKIDNFAVAYHKAKELKIHARKLIKKSFQKFFTYYCTGCKKRSYFTHSDSWNCCSQCGSDSHLYFVGFKQIDKFIEEVFYAN